MKPIRKISIGLNYPDGVLHYQVGKEIFLTGKSFTISTINKKQNEKGQSIYEIVLHDDQFHSDFVWKEIENMPVVVEYFIDIE